MVLAPKDVFYIGVYINHLAWELCEPKLKLYKCLAYVGRDGWFGMKEFRYIPIVGN